MKRFNSISLYSIILSAVFLVGCGQAGTPSPVAESQEVLPTVAAVAEIPTLPPVVTSSPLPATSTPIPTQVPPTATATKDPDQATVTPTPDLSIEPAVNITSLGDRTYQAGDALVISGRAARRSDQRLEAALVTLDGRELVTEEIFELGFGSWETNLALPATFSGQARFNVTVWNADNTPAAADTLLVSINPDTAQDRYLLLERPGANSEGAADYYLFFDGYAQRPVDFKITIAVKADNCQTVMSRQSFPMNGSGDWRGFVQIPETVEGEACAIAWFGEEGSADRREAQYLINVLPKEEGKGTTIGFPKTDGTVTAGSTVFFQGAALNATDSELSIQARLPDGSIAASDVVPVDDFGYWEAELLIPVEIAGEIQVTADGGTGQDSILLTVTE